MTRLEFDLYCSMRLELHEAEEKIVDQQNQWSTLVHVQAGKPLEFRDDDSFHSAGTSRKRRKSDDEEGWLTI